MPNDPERRRTIERANRTLRESRAIRDAADELMSETRELQRVLKRLQKQKLPHKKR